MLSITDVFYLPRVVQSKHNALPISRGQFFPNNSRKVPIARAWGGNMGVFREFEVWPNFIFEIVVLYAITCYILPQYIESLLYCARDTVFGVESTVVFGWSVLGARTSAFILMTLAGWCSPGVARRDEDWELTLISSLQCCSPSFISLKLEQKVLFFINYVFNTRNPEILNLYAQPHIYRLAARTGSISLFLTL